MEFPAAITLRDTGARRFPEPGEVYMWSNPARDGEVTGPYYCDDSEDNWMGQGTDFAIYVGPVLHRATVDHGRRVAADRARTGSGPDGVRHRARGAERMSGTTPAATKRLRVCFTEVTSYAVEVEVPADTTPAQFEADPDWFEQVDNAHDNWIIDCCTGVNAREIDAVEEVPSNGNQN